MLIVDRLALGCVVEDTDEHAAAAAKGIVQAAWLVSALAVVVVFFVLLGEHGEGLCVVGRVSWLMSGRVARAVERVVRTASSRSSCGCLPGMRLCCPH